MMRRDATRPSVFPNGVASTFAYEAATGRLQSIVHALGATELARFDYSYFNYGNYGDSLLYFKKLMLPTGVGILLRLPAPARQISMTAKV